ncbi:hypothetical protein [Phenylobacterium sp.]|jgi:tetratricopeptide (TPR) repeat protein|uniref:hypothetical protein n=1 Tax=Phenylobacterium sp. TaxID=1871053 RepID=UPI002F9215C1
MGEIAGGPPADEVSRELLRKQGGLIDDQRRHLRLQMASERAGLVLKGLTGVAGLAVAVVLGLMAWEASRSDGVVIGAFAAPPDFAARGMTGEVLASHVQDRLLAMQAATESGRDSATYSSDWGNDIRLEIPQTGVSLGELQRLLHEWLGRESVVTGDVVRTPQGLRLTVRTQGAAHAANGGETDLDALIAKAAEELYGETQPYRYGVYLLRLERFDEARAVYQRVALNSPPAEQAWAWIGLGNLASTEPEARAAFERAAQLNPNLVMAPNNLGALYERLGMAEQAYWARQRVLKLHERRDRGGVTAQSKATQRNYSNLRLGQIAGRWSDAAAAVEDMGRRPNFTESRALAVAGKALIQSALHEYGAARATAAAFGPDDASIRVLNSRVEVTPHLTVAAASGDWAGVLSQVEALKRLAESRPPHERRLLLTASLKAAEARALAEMGRYAEADALLGAAPANCYPCLITRAEIAGVRREPAASDRWYAAAAAAGPSLPHAHEAWGRARLQRGDAAGALALGRVAEERAPQWADPIELVGEALLAQGDSRAATERFARAVRLAPRWGRLHLKWGEALAASGDRAAARARWSAALGMDLSPSDRAQVHALLQTRA